MGTSAGQTSVLRESGRLPGGARLSGRYIVTGVLRDDGGSILYIGRTTAVGGEPVMIKEVVPDGFVSAENRMNAQARFLREVEVLQELKHPTLPTVLDAFSEQGRHYLIMSHCPGDTLETMLTRRGRPFAEEDVVGWTLEILSALGLMHRHAPPVIYRNVKPGNIVIDPSGTLRLLDFGLARFQTPGKRMDTAPIGPLGYAPPEQTMGSTDARSDIYALGVTMHHLLTFQHPTRYPPGALPLAHALNAEVSAELSAIVARAVEIDPGRRWPSTAEMEMALRRHIVALGGTSALRARSFDGPPSIPTDETSEPGARLVISAARGGGSDEVMQHLTRLTWMSRRELDRALSHLPTVVPLVEPYKASLRVLKVLGLEARPVWPLHGMHLIGPEQALKLTAHGRVLIEDPTACDDGLCLCRNCHFGWILEGPDESLPAVCPSCRRGGWNTIALLRCHWCGHEREENGAPACPCCGLISPEAS